MTPLELIAIGVGLFMGNQVFGWYALPQVFIEFIGWILITYGVGWLFSFPYPALTEPLF